MEDMLAVGFALDCCAVLWRHHRQHLRTQLVEAREGAVVHEGPAPVAERVGVLQSHSADRRPPHVRQNGLGIGAAGDTAEIRVVNGRFRLSHSLQPAVLVKRQAPSVEMACAAVVPIALDDQGVLGMAPVCIRFWSVPLRGIRRAGTCVALLQQRGDFLGLRQYFASGIAQHQKIRPSFTTRTQRFPLLPPTLRFCYRPAPENGSPIPPRWRRG